MQQAAGVVVNPVSDTSCKNFGPGKYKMAKYVVLWTSHKKAIVVSTTDGVEEVLHVKSKANGGMEEKSRHHRGEYYRKVIRTIQDATEIFIFGSAEAKMELKSEILKWTPLSHRVVGTEAVNTMTEEQLLARAREICGSRVV